MASKCPACAAEPGQQHQNGCDTALCVVCGVQDLQCTRHRRSPMQVWTGETPGLAECREWGWYARWDADRGWERLTDPTPEQLASGEWHEDLNRLHMQARWDAARGRFVRLG